jgi:Ca-activated chloride channel family protein
MNAQKKISWIVLITLIGLSACAPAAATPVPTAWSGSAEQADGGMRPQATAAPVNPQDNSYQDYGVNPQEDASRDNLSTFAVDVDTASYSVARRYLQGGSLPPYEAVRAEEFINSFDMHYPNPRGSAFGLTIDGAPAPFENDGAYLVRFGIQGYQVPDEERLPASLTFVIDVSGSMDMDNRLELVKDGLNLLVDELDERDSVAIVVYGSQARVALEMTSGADKSRIRRAIDGLAPEGSTNAAAGLHLGYQLALENYLNGGTNRLILCSDGVANVGTTDADALLAEVRGYVEENLYLTTVGFGMGNFNDTFMEQLADNGNGFYAYVDDEDEARKLFVDDLTATIQVIARDAKVQVDFNPAVVSEYRLIGYENREIADEDYFDESVDGGEIGAGHSVTALYVVSLNRGAEGEVGTLYLTWKDPQTLESDEIYGSIYTEDLAGRFEDADATFQLAAVVSQFAELLRESPYALASSMREVSSQARRLPRLLPEDGAVAEFAELAATAARLQR